MNQQAQITNRYYQLHSKIYDLTRWSFLFGRQQAVNQIILQNPKTVLEIGCGTGSNILKLAKALPNTKLFGLDASNEMLQIARKKNTPNTQWIQSYYPSPEFEKKINHSVTDFDCILFSYALTMFNPGWEDALHTAISKLSPNGTLILVDFNQTKFSWFKNWMKFNHVIMNGQLINWLERSTLTGDLVLKRAYGGIWQYFIFCGKNLL
jgi:S-adenosylmethionine-diacylgycerolhomoserine-N-methlytransferase